MSLYKYPFLLSLLVMLAAVSPMHAQTLKKELTDTFYYADDWTKIKPKYATYYRLPVIKVGDRFRVIYFRSNNVILRDELVKAAKFDYHYSVEPNVAVNDGPFKTYFSNGVISVEGEYDNGLPSGEWKKHYPSGLLRRTELFYKNQPFVYVTNYYVSGNKRSMGKVLRVKHKNDTVYRKEGLWVYNNDKEGSVDYILNFKLGLLNGEATYYDSATGKKTLVAQFRQDVRDSTWVYYSPKTGNVIEEDKYKQGLLDGDFYIKYEESGNLEMQGQYKDGIREGKWIIYYDANEKVQSITSYSNSDGHVVIYDSAISGQKILEGNVYQNKRVGEWVAYDKSLNVIRRETYNNGYLHGDMISYDEHGEISFNVPFRNGVKEGKASYYFPKSNDLFMVAKYVNDEIESVKTYYPDKKIKRKTVVNKDGAKTTECYAIDGSNIECEEWYFDAKFNGDVMIYIGNNLRYPPEAKRLNIQGKVKIAFTVDENGLVKDPYVLEGFDYECDAEALRLVTQMPPWEPLKIDGFAIATNKILPIVFWLPEEED